MMNRYYQFFAGTYFYVLKVNFFGKRIIVNRNYAHTAIAIMAFSEMLVFFYVMNMWYGPQKIADLQVLPLILCIVVAFWMFNYFLVIRRSKYIEIIDRYKHQKRGLLWVATAIYLVAVGLFMSYLISLIVRMP